MNETRASVRVWCYFLRPSLLRRPSSTAPLCSTLLNSAAQLCSTQLCSTLLSSAQLCSTLACASSARPRLGLRRYRAFVRPGIFSAPSLSSASACPLPSPLRGSGRAYLHPPTQRGRLPAFFQSGAFSTSPRKNFPGRNWNWCPSVMPLPRRCAACVVAGAPPAAASAPTGLVVRG